MKKDNLDNMVRGWFVGGFEPSVYKTTNVEVAVQRFKKGDKEKSHCHRIATEITVLVSGKAKMRDRTFVAGDIITVEPGEFTDFEALEDSTTAVVKVPGALNDKFMEREDD